MRLLKLPAQNPKKLLIGVCYMLLFGCSSVATLVNQRKVKLLADYVKHCNSVCTLFDHVAQNEPDALQNTRIAT